MSKTARDVFGKVTTQSITQEGLEQFTSILNSPRALGQFLSESSVNNSIDYNNVEAPIAFLEALFNTPGEQARDLFVKAMMNFKVIDKLMWGGKKRWLESRLDELDNDQVTRILGVPNILARIGLDYSYPLHSWLKQKIDRLDNNQVAEVLSARGTIEAVSSEKTIGWLTKTLDKLDQRQVARVLSSYEAVDWLDVYDSCWLEKKQEEIRMSKVGTLTDPAVASTSQMERYKNKVHNLMKGKSYVLS